MTIDLNADVGEGYDDAPLFAIVSSVNIACGAHAGDDSTMRAAADAARADGVNIGAHPGTLDRGSMGRAAVALDPEAVQATVAEQIARLTAIAGTLTHVKPHGALYNESATDPILARAIAAAIPHGLRLVGLAGSALPRAGAEAGLAVAHEAFADRRYNLEGALLPRNDPEALIDDPGEAAEQAARIALGEPIGPGIVVRAQTICVHADTPGALAIARAVRQRLEREGVAIAALQ